MVRYSMILQSWSEETEILVKLLFSFSIIEFNTMKLLVILFIITLFAKINVLM